MPYMQKEENIKWIARTDWKFARAEYDRMVKAYRNVYRT